MQRVERSVFGELNGKPIHLFRLSNANGMVAELLEFGGRIKALCIPDGQGGLDNMSVGYDTFEPYHAHFNPWLGALLGRTASRVTGARFQIDGKTYNLSASGPAGRHTSNDAVDCTVFLNSEGISSSHVANPQWDNKPLLTKCFELGGMRLDNSTVKSGDFVTFFSGSHSQIP